MIKEIRKEFNKLTKDMTEWLKINKGYAVSKEEEIEASLKFLKRAAAIVKSNASTIEVLKKNQ